MGAQMFNRTGIDESLLQTQNKKNILKTTLLRFQSTLENGFNKQSL